MVKEKIKPKQFVTDSNIPVKPVYYGQTKNSNLNQEILMQLQNLLINILQHLKNK